MDGFVKILGISVGLHETEAIKILSSQNIKVARGNNCVYTEVQIKFLGEDMHITYSLINSRIIKISLHWTFSNKGKLNSRQDESKVYEVGQKAINYISGMNVWKYNENITYDGKCRFVRTSFMDFYNKVVITTQYKTDINAINHVGVYITDINSEIIEKNEFDFLRSKYVLESACMNIGKNVKPNKVSIKIHASNFWFKAAIIIVLLLIGLLYVQNNRYYYTDKGKIRVDKWKNEWTRLDNNGEYTNTLKNR